MTLDKVNGVDNGGGTIEDLRGARCIVQAATCRVQTEYLHIISLQNGLRPHGDHATRVPANHC